MKRRITKRLVESIKAPENGRVKVYDDGLSGFGLVVYQSGKRSFFVEYGPRSRRRRCTLGAYPVLTAEQARRKATQMLGNIAEGEDPLDKRTARRQMPTFAGWADDYLDRVRQRKKQPRHDERYLADAQERWVGRRLDDIARRDVKVAHTEIGREHPTTANRWLASVRACLSEAVRDGLIEVNPAMGIRHLREPPPRNRTLSDDEFGRVMAAIDGLDNPHVRAALLVLVWTGLRKSEVLTARWDTIDLDHGVWHMSSTKAGTPRGIPLPPELRHALRSVPRVGPWFVPGRDPSKHRRDLKRPWEKVRACASIPDVTIHDVRRTFGLTVARMHGLTVASKLLTHSSVRVTERSYAPMLPGDFAEQAAEVERERRKVLQFPGGG